MTITPASTTINPILEKIAAYLQGHSNIDTIDPTAIAAELLPHIYILSIEPHDPTRCLRVRLTGTGIDAALDRCVHGKYMEDFLHGPHSSAVLDGFHTCAQTGAAIWMRQVVRIADRVPRYVEGVAFRIGTARIYGGLLFGEVSHHESGKSFERQLL